MRKIRVMLAWILVMLLLTGCGSQAAAPASDEVASEAAASEVAKEEEPEESMEESVEPVAEESAEESVEETEEAVEESSEESPVPEEPQIQVAGNVTGTETEKSVLLTNNTPWTITGIEIITPDGNEWTGPMLTEGETFQTSESFMLVFDPAAAAGIEMDYNVILTFAEGKEARLHGFPFQDTAEAVINYTDVVFIEYFSATKNEMKSSYKNELAISWSSQGGDDPNAGCVTDGVFN